MTMVTIKYAKSGSEPDTEAALELDDVRLGTRNRVFLDFLGATQLARLLGPGFMQKSFELSIGDITLLGCRLVEHGRDNVIEYMDRRAGHRG